MENDRRAICGAVKKSGKICEQGAGWGTDHLGFGQCKWHGGSTTASMIHEANNMAVALGVGIDVEPHEAILECVRLTAGEVLFCNEQIKGLSLDEVLETPEELIEREGTGTTQDGTGVLDIDTTEKRYKMKMVNIWVRARGQAMDRLAKYSKMALDAGVNERRVRVAENYAGILAPVLRNVFEELELTEEQRERAPEILRKYLTAVEDTSLALAPADLQA
jgi:hypothetical protein